MAWKKIDPEFKAKWLKALRSGRYIQGSSTLRAKTSGEYKYCCLGVACNLVDPKAWKLSDGSFTVFDWGSFKEDATKKFPFISDGASNRLATMNDGGFPSGKSHTYIEPTNFEGIADWIEKNL